MVGNLKPAAAQRILLVIFLMTFVVPLLSLVMLWLGKYIPNISLPDRKDRRLPFAMVTFFYLLITYMAYAPLKSFPVIIGVLATTTLCLLITTIITFYWKISAHSVGISGLVGFMMGLGFKYADNSLLIPILGLIMAAALVMSARLFLNQHTPSQVFGGAVVGFFPCLLAMMWS